MTTNIYYDVLKAEMPKKIPVADKPLRLGGKIEYVALEEFQKRLGCVYKEGITIEATTKISPFKENIKGLISADQLKKQVEKVLKMACENLVICNMGKCGYGVFASKDILKDTVVGIFSGTIAIGVKGSKISDKQDHAFGYWETNMLFSTKHHRGIASFMQHLPEEPKFKDAQTYSAVLKMVGQDISEEQLKLNIELFSTEFGIAKMKERIATENIRLEYLDFNKIPVMALVADKDIKAGDQLGFNYGYPYWLSRNITPEFFDKTGHIFSHNLYSRAFGQLSFKDFSYTGEYQPLIASLKQGRTSVTVIGDDKKSHEVSVVKLLSLLLNAQACQLTINTPFSEGEDAK